MAARRKPDRLDRLLELGNDVGVRELARILDSLRRSGRRLRGFLGRHPAGCRCGLCRAVLDQPAGEGLRDYLTAMMCALATYPGLIDCERPMTRREWVRVTGQADE